MSKKDTKRILEALEEQGWRVEETKKRHYMAYPPDKAQGPVSLGSTPSDWRSLRNALSLLKRRGFRWPV